MDEKQTRYILDLIKKHYRVGDSVQSDDDWVESHIENIKNLNGGRWVPGDVNGYLTVLKIELEKKYS